MKKVIGFLLLIFIFFVCTNESFAQKRNVIKTSVIPIFFKDYSLYFERGIHKNFSFSIGASYLPERGLPSLVTDLVNSSSVDLSKITFSGLAIIPEIRIFPGLKLRHPAPHG